MPQFPPDACRRGGQNAAPVNREMAREFYTPLIPIVLDLHCQGLSLRAIARELEQRGIKTRQEWKHWSATQIRRILARARKQLIAEISAYAAVARQTPPPQSSDCPDRY